VTNRQAALIAAAIFLDPKECEPGYGVADLFRLANTLLGFMEEVSE